MFSIRTILFVNICLALFFALNAETISVPENSILFNPDKKGNTCPWQLQAVAKRNFQAEVIQKEKVYLPQDELIGLFTDVYYLKIPGTDGLCYFPGVTFKKRKNGSLHPTVDKIDSLMFLGIFIFVMGLASLAGYFRMKSEKKKYLLPAALLFFFWGSASWYIGFQSDFFVAPSDDVYYFDIAKKLLALDFTSVKYHYTIGFPIFCIPLILLFRLQTWTDFMAVYMNFQTFILIPGVFLVLYRFFHVKMGFSRLQSFFTMILWLILAFFYLPLWVAKSDLGIYIPGTYYTGACFSFIEQNSISLIKFIKFIWLGRNALSDYAAVFLLIILLYFSMQKSRSLLRFFLLSMGFGYLCLVRINYIFFAPLLAFVFYDSFSGLWKNKRYYLYAVLCGTAGFLIVFGWQFAVNKIQFGSPLVWPYSLHPYAPDRGFVWSIVPYGFQFICQPNYVYITLGISSLFFIPERKTRVLLSLWIFPTLFFFCGYPVIFNSPVRFILALYPPLLAAFVINPVWKAAWNIRIKAAMVVVCSCVLCKSNIFFFQFQPWCLWKYGISNTVFMIIQGVICLFCCAVIFSMRKELKADYADTILPLRFLMLFTAVFFLGSACIYIVGLLVLAAFVYGLRDTWMEIEQISWKKEIDAPAIPGSDS